ncbi:MAG: DUF6164 family protein [Pseudomonadales bacterium]|nr:DUF6164 family protein [Pseudomonadales bacterium]
MTIQLLKLRDVPDDEQLDIRALLDEHGIDYYETSAGNWGISMPALWLKDASQFQQARALLDAYAQQRLHTAKEEYQHLQDSGKARTLLDIVRENPLRFIVYMLIIIGLATLSVVPFLSF